MAEKQNGGTGPIDETGWRILEELQRNGRISYRDLAEKVNLSPSAAMERVKRMEQEGVITGYGIRIDPRKTGYIMTAILSVSTKQENTSKIIANLISDVPEVVTSWSVTGTFDHILEVHLPSLEFLELLLTRLSVLGHVTTQIVLPSFSELSGLRVLKQPREKL
ncbi:Lrp/AsnC family transcriptional regulator [Synergistaceae bacterium OttesenSCG-928-D05]|nr:Lrp/AsnC family transcriptional regulator [Synergistaceae bacterium OttesenSCG-928-D05]